MNWTARFLFKIIDEHLLKLNGQNLNGEQSFLYLICLAILYLAETIREKK